MQILKIETELTSEDYKNLVEALQSELKEVRAENTELNKILDQSKQAFKELKKEILFLRGKLEAKNKKQELESRKIAVLSEMVSQLKQN